MRHDPPDDPSVFRSAPSSAVPPDFALRAAEPRSHWWPRTARGRFAVAVFLVLLALAQPPFVHGPANRIEPRVLGMPFLYTYLLLIYLAMIAVLVWAQRRRL